MQEMGKWSGISLGDLIETVVGLMDDVQFDTLFILSAADTSSRIILKRHTLNVNF